MAALALVGVSATLASGATNNISTVAGSGEAGYNGDGIPAATALRAGKSYLARPR